MATKPQDEVKIDNYLSEPLTVGEPDVSGPIAVYPVFGGVPNQDYTFSVFTNRPDRPDATGPATRRTRISRPSRRRS